MSFQDVFKKSFMEGFTSMDITTSKVLATLLMVVILSLYIFLIYRVVTRKTFFSKGFAVSLASIAVITAGIILAMQSNLVISLGMVGALSIVRFRTAIKDPMDLVFLFWSISVGIICGAGLAQVAVILSIVITLGILILDQLPIARAPMILVINASDLESEERIEAIVTEYDKHFKVKSRNMTASTLDMIIELRTNKGGELVRSIMKEEGILSASLLSHDGEVTF